MPPLVPRLVSIDAIHPDPANLRLHPDRNLEAIKSSLVRFGQQKPIVVDRGGTIRAGNGTYAAAKALGWTEIHVVETDLEGVEAVSYAIADNRTAELAEWDNPALAKLLVELRDEDALDGVGFEDIEIDALLEELAADLGSVELDDPGEQAPPDKPVSLTGDLWQLGDHRLLVGDSTSAADLARLMAGEKAALLSTDPPYCVSYTGNDRPIHDGKASGKDWTHVYNEVEIADLGEFMDGAFAAALPCVAEDAGIYIWHAHVQQPTIAAAFERHGLLLHQVLVWVKPCATFGHSYYRWKHEPCAFGWKRGHKPTHGVGQLETVWEADWEGKQRITTFHPTSKPTRLFEIPIEQHTKPGDILLEPFCGSGSQILAAERLGRRCYAIDIQPAFVDGTILRWQKATGRRATLDGKTMETVAAERGAA
jgi:DNA modification methylase